MNTVVTYIYGDTEYLRDPLVITQDTQYVVFTDNTRLKSSVWKPIYNQTDPTLSTRDQVASIKFNPFIIPSERYIILDASHEIKSDLTPIFNLIDENTLLVKRHPARVCLHEEIRRWQTIRNMSDIYAQKIHSLINIAGAHYYNTPIYEGCFIGVSSSPQHQYLFHSIINMLKLLRNGNDWFPSNQMALSFLISKLSINILPINTKFYVNRYEHHSWRCINEFAINEC